VKIDKNFSRKGVNIEKFGEIALKKEKNAFNF
jgi:hypothetical protein